MLFGPFLAAAAADLDIWCCLTMAGGAFPPVGGNVCCGGGFVFGLDDGVVAIAIIACDANVFFLISFCMRFASACSTFDAGSSSSLEKNSEIFESFLVACLSFDWVCDGLFFDLGEPLSSDTFEFAFIALSEIFCDGFVSIWLPDALQPCELDESESLLDEFDWSVSLELALDDELELLPLESVELNDWMKLSGKMSNFQ